MGDQMSKGHLPTNTYEKILAADSILLDRIRPNLSSVLDECCSSRKMDKDFWATDNLLRCVVPYHARCIVANFDSVYEDVKAGRSSTFPIIERAMFEQMLTFEYCVEDCPDALGRWVAQSLKDHLKMLGNMLAYDAEVITDSIWLDQPMKQRRREIESLIARAPDNVTGALPALNTMREKVLENHPEKKRLWRLSYMNPSSYVHSAALHFTLPIGTDTAGFTLWLLINRAMRICRDRKLVAWENRERAQNIIEVCEGQLAQ